MKPYLPLGILAFLVNTCLFAYSQDNVPLWVKADSAYRKGQYETALQLYKQQLSSEKILFMRRNSYYNIACTMACMGDTGTAWRYLDSALLAGYDNYFRILTNKDLKPLQNDKERWKKIGALNIDKSRSLNDPLKAELVTDDIHHFWEAYDMAAKDTLNQANIFNNYYFAKASAGLQDYFTLRIGSTELFLRNQNRKKEFYKSIRNNTLRVDALKDTIRKSFIKLKDLYPSAVFPNVYFVIGRWSSAGTVSNNGLLIGTDMLSKSEEVPLHELSLWEKNNYKSIDDLPYIVAHELIHSQQNNLRLDTTTLSACIREGMADFLGELIAGKTSNERLQLFAKGKEKKLWQEFSADMYLNRSNHWIANSAEETPDRPADLGYWIGYIICKSYYENAADKNKAVFDILHIKNYRKFLEESKVESKIMGQ